MPKYLLLCLIMLKLDRRANIIMLHNVPRPNTLILAQNVLTGGGMLPGLPSAVREELCWETRVLYLAPLALRLSPLASSNTK